ncbi:YdeI/OmpD-associated family protein [Skermania piniformis]|uniref:YdeI/OmpD-associated family protein n=1 Tax=Skermania pinensis TaxID=39122 RepID=A0ABX8S5A7_9ACTN|nr:YdeI/OmpD-associated family protein [Skermania piniformis]QXQ12411.1 YdeI/OmpD-associated family protein [Skermania piniformis]
MTDPTAIGTAGGSADRPATFFAGPDEFRRWLTTYHATATDLWMGLYKKHVPDRGLTWHQAVPEALCFGWIDSVVQRIDDDAVRQRWTPRRPGSNWSAVNIEHVARLTAEGRMQPAGLAAFERRRADRSGVYSYENPPGELPPDYAGRLAADPAAGAFWAAATASYRRVAINWVNTAKQQATRDKRMAQLIADSAAGRLIPSQRYGVAPTWVERAAAAARAAGELP